LFFFLRQINFSPPVIRFKTCAAHCLLGFFFLILICHFKMSLCPFVFVLFIILFWLSRSSS
jgi:hypothetical protein